MSKTKQMPPAFPTIIIDRFGHRIRRQLPSSLYIILLLLPFCSFNLLLAGTILGILRTDTITAAAPARGIATTPVRPFAAGTPTIRKRVSVAATVLVRLVRICGCLVVLVRPSDCPALTSNTHTTTCVMDLVVLSVGPDCGLATLALCHSYRSAFNDI